jgi:hypothetical protein
MLERIQTMVQKIFRGAITGFDYVCGGFIGIIFSAFTADLGGSIFTSLPISGMIVWLSVMAVFGALGYLYVRGYSR